MAASLSGLTEEQAQEFHAQFKIGFQTWLAIAIVAHVLTSPGAPGSDLGEADNGNPQP